MVRPLLDLSGWIAPGSPRILPATAVLGVLTKPAAAALDIAPGIPSSMLRRWRGDYNRSGAERLR
jgi:hypothetical protein